MTRGVADHHFPDGELQLLAASHAWRCILRQAAAYLSGLSDAPCDRATRTALSDAVDHVQHACTLLTRVQLATDNSTLIDRRVDAAR
jgi:hypothetical protein